MWPQHHRQPYRRAQVFIVEQLLEWKADLDIKSIRGATVLMEIAGAGHVPMFKYWYERIVKHNWTCDLEAVNADGRNLWSIAGLAHEYAGKEKLRKYVNAEVKLMVQHLADFIIIIVN